MVDYSYLKETHPNLFSNDNAYIKIILDSSVINEWQKNKREELLRSNKPQSWSDIGVVLDDPYIVVIRDLVEFPDGHINSYFRIINKADLGGGQGVVVIPEMGGKILLLHQYRHPTRSWSYELPRGFGEPGIPADEQARNEVREEVEGEISLLTDLGIIYSNTGLEGNKVRLFHAKLKSIGRPDKNEGIESLIWVTLPELEKMIASSVITDGFTIAAYTRAKLLGLL